MHISIKVEIPTTFKLRMAETDFCGLPYSQSSHSATTFFSHPCWFGIFLIISVCSKVNSIGYLFCPSTLPMLQSQLCLFQFLDRTSKIQKPASHCGIASRACGAFCEHNRPGQEILTQQDTDLYCYAAFQPPQICLNRWWRIIAISNKLPVQPTSLSSHILIAAIHNSIAFLTAGEAQHRAWTEAQEPVPVEDVPVLCIHHSPAHIAGASSSSGDPASAAPFTQGRHKPEITP